ncbi:GCG_CRPN prefix-to-repeats domain-containing protein [Bradyrhizobium sp. UFLA05-109]
MKALFVTALVTAIVAGVGLARAADGCGPGCHATISGACVVDGWGSGARVWNECPAGAHPRRPCPSGYFWSRRMRACFASD